MGQDNAETAQQIENVIGEIRKILRSIASSEQPASQLEIAELKALGETYARLTERLQVQTDEGETDRLTEN